MADLTGFYYHTVNFNGVALMSDMRSHYITLAKFIDTNLPESRYKDLALTELEYSLMRSIQGLAVLLGTKQDVGA